MMVCLVRDCIVVKVDTTDDTDPSAVVEKMQTTITGDSPLTAGVSKLLFKELINQ